MMCTCLPGGVSDVSCSVEFQVTLNKMFDAHMTRKKAFDHVTAGTPFHRAIQNACVI